MFLLFGMGKQTVKRLGKTSARTCGHCHKRVELILVKVVDWFTVFFIPIIPYMTRYALICPLCEGAREVDRDELNDISRELSPVDPDDPGDFSRPDGNSATVRPANRYHGKNPTQAAYLAKLEARERALEEQTRREREEKEERDGDEPDDKSDDYPYDKPADTPDEVTDDEAGFDTGKKAANAGANTFEAKMMSLRTRELSLEAREKAVEAREKAILAREKACEARELEINGPL